MPAGSEVGIPIDGGGDAGYSNRHLIIANAYHTGDGNWKFLNEQTYSYGFFNIQQGFNLRMYGEKVVLATPKTERTVQPDWTTISQVIKSPVPENFLRGDLTAATKDEIVTNIRDYFATVDLANVDLGDPIQYFANSNNQQFVYKELAIIDQLKANDFQTETDRYLQSFLA